MSNKNKGTGKEKVTNENDNVAFNVRTADNKHDKDANKSKGGESQNEAGAQEGQARSENISSGLPVVEASNTVNSEENSTCTSDPQIHIPVIEVKPQTMESPEENKPLENPPLATPEITATPEDDKDIIDGIKTAQQDEGLDEPDRASLYSLYMQKNFHYYFQHPYLRLIIAYLVTFCNFLIYAEDPVAHSQAECYIPVVGNCVSFVINKYPPNALSLLKVFMWVMAIAVGLIVGKFLVHKLIFNKLFRLKMFHEDQGSWMTMFFTCILSLFVFSWIYNALLMIGGDATKQYQVSQYMGIRNSTFMKLAACGTWCGDFFTAWMVTDIMLQEKLYPKWAIRVRKWWTTGYHRIILFWSIVIITTTIVYVVIWTDEIRWDSLNRDLLPSNEVSRAFLASFILVMDLLIVMQDWDFPHFINNLDIKLPGLNTSQIKFTIPKFLKKIEKWTVHITGKWFNYGILIMVMILDLNMWKNQIFYEPYDYGQYAGPEGRIHSVLNRTTLDSHNKTWLSHEWRSVNPNVNNSYLEDDLVINSRFYDYSLALKGLAFIPSLIAFIVFIVLIWFFGRWKPTPKDPHGGRLKKRLKKRKSFFERLKFRGRGAKRKQEEATPAGLEEGEVELSKVTSTTNQDVIFDGKDYVN